MYSLSLANDACICGRKTTIEEPVDETKDTEEGERGGEFPEEENGEGCADGGDEDYGGDVESVDEAA